MHCALHRQPPQTPKNVTIPATAGLIDSLCQLARLAFPLQPHLHAWLPQCAPP